MGSVSRLIKDAAWKAYVWPKGRWGSAGQRLLLELTSSLPAMRRWERAQKVYLVHTPGKVGSKAIAATLREAVDSTDAVFHTHRMNPRTWESEEESLGELSPRRTALIARRLGQAIAAQPSKKLVVFTAFRDPVERNLSDFFQNAEQYLPDRKPLNAHDADARNLARAFERQFPHKRANDWYDSEIVDLFGVDIYSRPFPQGQGFDIFENGNITVAVIRYDRLAEVLPLAAKAADQLQLSRVPRRNSSGDKQYARLYETLQQTVRLPQDILDSLYNDRFARHFFSHRERTEAMTRWRSRY